MSPRSLLAPRSVLGSLTLVFVLVAAAAGLAFYSHIADQHNRAKNTPAARLAAWTPPAGLTEANDPIGCTTSAVGRCLTSTAGARATATSIAPSLDANPADVTCRVVRGTADACNFLGKIGSSTFVVVITDQAALAAPVTVPAKPSAGSSATGSLVDIGLLGAQ